MNETQELLAVSGLHALTEVPIQTVLFVGQLSDELGRIQQVLVCLAKLLASLIFSHLQAG